MIQELLLKTIPNDKYDWEKNREKYSLNPYAAGLVEIFKDNPIKLINYFCGVNLVDYLVIEDMRDGVWRVTSMNDFSNTIKNNIKNVYNTEGGKLVISGGEKNNILFDKYIMKKTKKNHHNNNKTKKQTLETQSKVKELCASSGFNTFEGKLFRNEQNTTEVDKVLKEYRK
jgi:hypothetical protein